MVKIKNIDIGGGSGLVLFAGPCIVENREMILSTAEAIKNIAAKHNVPVVFKSSFKKANRTSGLSFSGIGTDEALKILAEVKREFDLPIITDIHTEEDARIAAEVADVLQIPAFLCRQTDLLHAAGSTGKVVNIKKGQFLAPEDMKHAALKVAETGNVNILLTERGSTFGYNNLVVDMRALKIMRDLGYPVVFDATHSVQLPGGNKMAAQTGGQPEYIFPLARAGAAVGIDGLFVEVHPDPAQALSDSSSQLKLDLLESLIQQVTEIDKLVKQYT